MLAVGLGGSDDETVVGTAASVATTADGAVVSTTLDLATTTEPSVTSSVPATTEPATVAPIPGPVTTAPPLSLLEAIIGIPQTGQACRDSVAINGTCPSSQKGSWAFVMTIVNVSSDVRVGDGTIEWLELGSLHAISVSTDGNMTINFVETAAIDSGQALLGCEYDITVGNSGRWSCPDGSAGPFEFR